MTTQLKINSDIMTTDESITLPLCVDVDEGAIHCTYYDGTIVDYETAEEFAAAHQLDTNDPETAIFVARIRAELTEDGKQHIVSTILDLRAFYGDGLGPNGSAELAEAVTDALHLSDHRPEYGDDWGPFLANVDAWQLIEMLDKAGRLEVQP